MKFSVSHLHSRVVQKKEKGQKCSHKKVENIVDLIKDAKGVAFNFI